MRYSGLRSIWIHIALIGYTIVAMFPILLIVINSFKERRNIFSAPYALPLGDLFSLTGYVTIGKRADVFLYMRNSLIVTVGAVVLVLLLGAMASFGLSEYKFRGSGIGALYFLLGIMIPIRLGTVGIVKVATALSLTGTLQGLIFVYVAQNIPLAVFILMQFMREVPHELKDAARIDGASELKVFWLSFVLVRPALFSIAVLTMIPVWNDLWFPLVMASGEDTKTLTLGVQVFMGQVQTNWSALLAMLTVAMLPVLIFYTVFSRTLIRGLMAGAVKQ